MKFCSACGDTVDVVIPDGDNRPRHVCQKCGEIHYQNPKIVTGCIAEWENKILLCKRAIEPRKGLWTLPAGFMENGETNLEGALREANEEANAYLAKTRLFCMLSIPHISQVYTFYRSELVDGAASAGAESEAVALFEQHEIPWDELAFPVVIETLKLYYDDIQQRTERVHFGDLIKSPDGRIEVKIESS